MVPQHQTVYIVSAIHCPAPDGINPGCYTITGAYATANGAKTAMLAKAKELYHQPITHMHGTPKKGTPEWKESEFKVEFRGKDGDIGVCWVDERVLGVEEIPIQKTLQPGRFGGMGHKDEAEAAEWGMTDIDAEKTLCSLLRF